MLQTDLFFNEAKSIFIVILLIFILKGDTIMVIIRNGKEIELTWDEVSDAHKEFVTSWMSGIAVSDFDVDIYTSRHFTHSFNMHIHQSTLDLHFIHCFSSNTTHSHNIFIADLIYVSRHFFYKFSDLAEFVNGHFANNFNKPIYILIYTRFTLVGILVDILLTASIHLIFFSLHRLHIYCSRCFSYSFTIQNWVILHCIYLSRHSPNSFNVEMSIYIYS